MELELCPEKVQLMALQVNSLDQIKAIFCSIIKSEEQETVIRDVWRRGFEEITTTREEFALPPEETILESLLEGRIE